MNRLNLIKQQAQRRYRGAIGKAFLVYLGTGSVVTAVIAYLIFAGMGC